MKNLSPLFEEAYHYIYINWHKPIKLTEVWTHLSDVNQDNVYLYKLVAKRGEKYRLIYIGMSEKHKIQQRLFNKDHKIKQKFMQGLNKGWTLYCSIGEYTYKLDEDKVSFNWAAKQTRIIEKLLIIAHSETPYLQNKKSVNWFSSGAWVRIANSGFMDDKMHRIISYGPHYVGSTKK